MNVLVRIIRDHAHNAVFVLLLLLCTPAFPASEIQELAHEAKQRFNSVMQPPISKNPLYLHTLFLEATTPHRGYVVDSFNEAIDALVAEAEQPGRMAVVTEALRQFVKDREPEGIENVFAEMLANALADKKTPNPQAAAVLRHSVALFELEGALESTIFPFFPPISPFLSVTLNRGFFNIFSGIKPNFTLKEGYHSIASGIIKPMPGPKTLPAYKQAALLAPYHLWTWIVIASLAQQPQDFESALTKAEAIARTQGDRHALVFVKLELGRLRNRFKLPNAVQAYEEAVGIATISHEADPTNDT
jgi:hypothetical protein